MKTKKKEKVFEEFLKFAADKPEKFKEEMREAIWSILMTLRPILICASILKENFGDKSISEASLEEIFDIAKLLNYMLFHIKNASEGICGDIPEKILAQIQAMDMFFEEQINRVVH